MKHLQSLNNFIKKLSLKVVDPSIIKRIIWALTYIGSISLFMYYSINIYIKWYIDPDISITIRNVPSHQIPFPAMTFCTPYIISDELANFTDFQMRLYLNKSLPEYSQKEKEYLSSTLDVCGLKIAHGAKILNFTNPQVIKSIHESRKYKENLNAYCGMEAVNLDCRKMFNVVPTEHGLCYSFNMQGYNTIFNKGLLHSDFDFYQRKKIAKSMEKKSKLYNETVNDNNEAVHWTLQDGYLSDTVNSVPYRFSKRSINLYLGFSNFNFFHCLLGQFRILYHLPNEAPIAINDYVKARVSYGTTITLEAKSVKRGKSMQKYSPEIRQCFFDGEKKLKFFKSYTKAHCDLECLTNYTIKICGCAKFYMPRTPESKVCSLVETECATATHQKFAIYKSKIDEYDIPCNCLQPCNHIKYSVKERISDEISALNPIIKIMMDQKLRGRSVLNVFSAGWEVEEHEYFVGYDLQNFIADIGGLLGLFMGYSFLTIAELVQKLIIYSFEIRANREVGRRTGTLTNVQPRQRN